MDNRKHRMSIDKLRTSDVNTLQVLIQDVLGQPLRQIDPATMVDLLALSEIPSQLPLSMNRDLDDFRKQMFGQITDLPDGPALSEFIEELGGLSLARLPLCLREHLAGMVAQRHRSQGDLQALLGRLEAADAAPQVLTLPEPRKGAAAKKPVAKATAPRKASGPPKAPPSQVDERRAEWIAEDVLDRLANYGPRGLKESVLVAGARHRSSWNDMTDEEILTVLRRLRRESKVRFSAGRWMLGAG